MTEIPANFAQPWPGASRVRVPLRGDERAVMTAMLDFHRATLELKCAGVPPAALSERGVPPSGLSPHGLGRHLAGFATRR